MKNIFSCLFFLFCTIIIMSCEKEDRHAKKLYRHEGRWTIDYASVQFFDSTGVIMSDSIIPSVGELVMFQSGSLNALYGYRQAVFLFTDTAGTHAFPFEYVFDGKRITIKYCDAPFEIDGTYSSAIDKVNEQQWEIYGTNGNTSAISSMTSKFILHLKRSKN